MLSLLAAALLTATPWVEWEGRESPFEASSVSVPSTAQASLGQTAQGSSGQVGERSTRDQIGQAAGIKPTARIANRIQNRVQTRIQTRIDRNYRPRTSAASAFKSASEEAAAPKR